MITSCERDETPVSFEKGLTKQGRNGIRGEKEKGHD